MSCLAKERNPKSDQSVGVCVAGCDCSFSVLVSDSASADADRGGGDTRSNNASNFSFLISFPSLSITEGEGGRWEFIEEEGRYKYINMVVICYASDIMGYD